MSSSMIVFFKASSSAVSASIIDCSAAISAADFVFSFLLSSSATLSFFFGRSVDESDSELLELCLLNFPFDRSAELLRPLELLRLSLDLERLSRERERLPRERERLPLERDRLLDRDLERLLLFLDRDLERLLSRSRDCLRLERDLDLDFLFFFGERDRDLLIEGIVPIKGARTGEAATLLP